MFFHPSGWKNGLARTLAKISKTVRPVGPLVLSAWLTVLCTENSSSASVWCHFSSEMHLVCKSHFFCFPFSFLPDAELESLFKKHFVSVSFFKGTVLNGDDCQRVKVGSWIV